MDDKKLEEKALEMLANFFYSSGYRKGVYHGIGCAIGGVLVGLGVAIAAHYQTTCRSKKTNDE